MRAVMAAVVAGSFALAGCSSSPAAPAGPDFSSLQLPVTLSTTSSLTLPSAVVLAETTAGSAQLATPLNDITFPCRTSGTITMNGAVNDARNASGTGTVTATTTLNFNACSTGTAALTGNPNLQFTATQDFRASQPIGPATITASGGFAASSKGAYTSITLNCTDTLDATTRTLSAAGVVTVQVAGQNPTTVACLAF